MTPLSYTEFIARKKPLAQLQGFIPKSAPHPSLFPHQRDIAIWMVRGGRRANFSAFGLGKTRQNLQVGKCVCEECPGKKYLIVAPLGVRYEFIHSEGPAMGIPITFCRTTAEVDACETGLVITNYESVRDGKIEITPERFAGCGLDEGSVLRSFGSKTFQEFQKIFAKINYRFVFTATPSPNRHKELIHYAGFLGIMDTGQALTRFFQRDSSKAGNLTLHPHMEEDFWEWMASWSVFLQKPSDLGYSDEGYILPGFETHWHCVPVDHKQAWDLVDSWGQKQLFLDKSAGLRDLAITKKASIISRIAEAQKIIAQNPDDHFIIWHDLEEERRVIERMIPGVKTIFGTQELEIREDTIAEFSRGELAKIGTKPILSGSGTNMQKFCHRAIFLGSTYKFNDFIQALHRILRYGQKYFVDIYVIYTESEDPVISSLKTKWAQHNVLVAKMSELLRKFKLDLNTMQIIRKSGCDRTEVKSKTFRAINNDCVLEMMEWKENQVDLVVTSIPFGNQYEYANALQDFGYNPTNKEFFDQMDYFCPQLYKVINPGRLACIHVKDRIRFGNQHGTGVPTVDRFSDKTADIMEKHGFFFLGRITIDTDVVRENAQTYRLGWSENAKDSTKMGVGMQEYVLIFRKPHSDLSKAYADVPVIKDKSVYMRADWQIDADGFWKSDGNRLPDPDLIANMATDGARRLWVKHCKEKGYRWKEHVKLCKDMEDKGRLPASFMLFPPISNNPGIWTDIARMRVLNSEQKKRNEEMHVCPLQLDICNRLITRYSNPGEIVFDPFAGIFTVPYCAIHLGRKGWGTELSTEYTRCGVGYCEQAEREREMPTLFDMPEVIAK